MTPYKKAKYMRQQPRLDIVMMRGKSIDISMKLILEILFGEVFDIEEETPKYDYHMVKLNN